MNKVLYLVRHTRTAMEQGICYGQTDVEVAGDFERAAQGIKDKLSGVAFDRVYSSPLKRCHRLAKVLAQNSVAGEALSSLLDKSVSHASTQKVVVDERLMEMNFGDWEQRSWEEIYALPEGKRWFADYISTACPEGESFTDLLDRVSGFMRMLDETPQQNVLIVAHAGTIRAMLVYLGFTTAGAAFTIPVEYGEVVKIEKNSFRRI